MQRARHYVFSAVSVAVGLVEPASADVKAYHGSICQPQVDSFTYGETGIGGNGGPLDFVICPLVRDRISSSNSLHSVYAELSSDSIIGDGLACTLYSMTEDANGQILDSHQLHTSHKGKVQLGPFDVTMSNGNEGSLALGCLLGDGDRLYQIYVNENDSATD